MGFSNNSQLRHYVGSTIMVMGCLLLIGFLLVLPIPAENKAVIDTVIGILLTGVVLAMKVVTGGSEEQTKEMQRRIEDAERETQRYKERVEHISAELESTKRLLVQLQTDVIKELALLTRKNR